MSCHEPWQPCWACSTPAPNIDMHHIIPRADGGDDAPTNKMPLCKSCHERVTTGFADLNYLIYMLGQLNSPSTPAWVRILFLKCGEYAHRNNKLQEAAECKEMSIPSHSYPSGLPI
jgi:hypothetical protein